MTAPFANGAAACCSCSTGYPQWRVSTAARSWKPQIDVGRRYASTTPPFGVVVKSVADRVARAVASPAPISTSPRADACSRRAATLTASPVTQKGSAPRHLAVLTPIEPEDRATDRYTHLYGAGGAGASSSCETGTEHGHDRVAMNFSHRRDVRGSSASRRNGRASCPERLWVDDRAERDRPVRSQKTMVTVLRTSRGGSAAVSKRRGRCRRAPVRVLLATGGWPHRAHRMPLAWG
jgi:hypothetical protein